MDKEQERAAFYQQHKDDPDVWGDPEPGPPEEARKGLSISITVRFPADDAALIRRFVEDQGLTYSDVVRKAVGQYVRPTFDLKITDMPGNLFYNLGSRRTGTSLSSVEFANKGPSRETFTAPSGARY